MKRTPISNREIRNMTMMYLDKRVLSRIRLSFWTLFLEFGELDAEKHRWEVSIMIDPSWKFQKQYAIQETSDRDRQELEKSLKQYVWKKLLYCIVDDYLHEIHLDFWDVYFATLSTTPGWSGLCRTIFFNGNWDESGDALPSCIIESDNEWIYISKRTKKGTA